MGNKSGSNGPEITVPLGTLACNIVFFSTADPEARHRHAGRYAIYLWANYILPSRPRLLPSKPSTD